jgi:hypothetical protein
VRYLLLGALVLGALTVAPSAGAATNECRGLNPCVPVAGPWVVVPTAATVPRPQAQYQLTCPRGFVVAGIDAELSDQAIDLAFLGTSGTPVSPGVTTSRSIVFVASYVGGRPRAPTFRPHIGCIPASGGGSRTPTAVRAVTPPGHPTTRRVVTARVRGQSTVDTACRADERLVGWYLARGFATAAPPAPAVVASLYTKTTVSRNAVSVVARAGRGQGIVQLAAICAGGK